MDITWEDPPPVTHDGPRMTEAQRLAQELKEHEGKWAKIRDYRRPGEDIDRAQRRAAAARQTIVKGRTKAWELEQNEGAFEAVVRHGVLYARYVAQ